MSTLQATFAQRLESVGGVVRPCGTGEVLGLVLEAASAFPQRPVIFSYRAAGLLPDLAPALERRGVECRAARTVDDALACPVGLSAGLLAVAETGSVLLAERDLAQRAISMLCTVHLVLLPEERLVPDLDAAGTWLHEHVKDQPYVSFVTGPSRTADIERTLTIGVQGPRELVVVCVSHEL
jgi:L-lactate dehydrogenase complex protein LldG